MRSGRVVKIRAGAGRGFSLIELLVVVVVIGLLIAILLPVLALARESGKQVKCLAHVRTIGQGFQAGLAERNGVFPHSILGPSIPSNPPIWSDILDAVFPVTPNLKWTGTDSFGACPSVQQRYANLSYQTLSDWGYAYNVWWKDGGVPGVVNPSKVAPEFFNQDKLVEAVLRPSDYPLFLDPAVIPDGATGYHQGNVEAPNWSAKWASPALGTGQHHSGVTSNAAFADGSARGVTRAQIMADAATTQPYRFPFFAND